MEKRKLSEINKKKTLLVILVVIVLVGVLHFIHPAGYCLEGNSQVKEDFTKLNKNIAALDSDQIDLAISKAAFDVKLKQVNGNQDALDNRFVFSKSVLVGDSLAEGIVDYGILDSSNVFAKRGKRLVTSDDLFSQAISARPENLFIEFGMNDLIAYRGKEAPFIKEYKRIIKKFKDSIPSTNLYVVSVSTISPQGVAEQPSMKNFDGYNRAMKKMCKEENIHFIDTTLLLDGSSEYEFDGIHPKEPFYSNWVKLMCSYILENSEV